MLNFFPCCFAGPVDLGSREGGGVFGIEDLEDVHEFEEENRKAADEAEG